MPPKSHREDPLLVSIKQLRSNLDASLLHSTFQTCLTRLQSPDTTTTRQGLDGLAQWIVAAKSAPREHIAFLREDELQVGLTGLVWDRLDDSLGISKRMEGVAVGLLGVIDGGGEESAALATSSSTPSSSASTPRQPCLLALSLLRRSNADHAIRTSLVVYDVLLSVYDGRAITSPNVPSSPTLQQLYAQLSTPVSSHVDTPTRRARVCRKILRSYAREVGLRFEEEGGQQRDAFAQWSNFALTPIIEALRSPDPSKRTSTSWYQLADLLELAPAALVPLLAALEAEENADTMLPATLAALRAANTQGLVRTGNEAEKGKREFMLGSGRQIEVQRPDERWVVVVPQDLLAACASSTVEELAISSISLVVEGRTLVRPFTPSDYSILHAFLSASFSTTHPSGRGAVHSLFGKLLARLAANHRAAKKAGNDEEVAAIRFFVKGLARDITAALHPGSPYHIVIAALTFLETILLAGVDSSYDRTDLTVRDVASSFGKFDKVPAMGLDVIDEGMVRALLSCSDSTYEDIQQRGLGLLRRFPAPLAGMETRDMVQEKIVGKAKRLLLSGRDSESTAAGYLLQLYERVYVRKLGWPVEVSGEGTLFTQLLNLLEENVRIAETDGLYAAAKTAPLHGTLITLKRMLGEERDTSIEGDARALFARTQSLIDRVWAITRPILCAAAPEGANEDNDDGAADTEVARALAASGDGSLPFNSARKSQLMLSYSWRGIKEAAALLGAITSRFLPHLGVQELEGVGARFTTWMTAIRHRGAFSTVYPAFASAAAALVRSERGGVAAMPRTWLRDFVATVAGAQGQAISTTRRSAGVGYAVLALLTAMPLRKDSTALDETVAALTSAATSGAHPQIIHSLNILRVLILDASLVPHLSTHIDSLLSLSIRRFRSPIWYVRNAALMLFSSLAPRAFPARRANEDDVASSLPANRFFGTYPSLHGALREHLEQSISAGLHRGEDAQGSASLYAVLFLLSRMQAVEHEEEEHGDPAVLRELVGQCLGSPDAKMREVAGKAWVGMCVASAEERREGARELLEGMGEDENRRHATLLVIARLGVGKEGEVRERLEKLDLAGASPAVREAWQEALTAGATPTPNGHSTGSVATLRATLWNDDLADFQSRVRSADTLVELEDYHGQGQEDWDRAATLVMRSSCVPLREAVLVLLGKLSATASGAQLRLYARLVATCADEETHVESRLAAAQSLAAFAKHGGALFARGDGERALFTLRLSAITLLHDDDEEVRLVAAQIVADHLTTGSSDAGASSLLAAAQRTVASSSVSTSRAWSFMASTYPGATSPWYRHLARLVLPPAAELDEAWLRVKGAGEQKGDEPLFAAERPNLYRDVRVEVLRAAEALKGVVSFERRAAEVKERLKKFAKLPSAASIEADVLGVRLVSVARSCGLEKECEDVAEMLRI